MAIVKAPALSIAASGNLGGICYTTYRGLQIAKSPWSGVVPNTSKQVIQQGLMTTVSQAWGGTLSSAERETWNRRATTVIWEDRFGEPYIPNGYQLFMKWNIRRRVMGLALMLTAPSVQKWGHIEFFSIASVPVGGYIAMSLRESVGVYVNAYGVEFYRAGPYDSGGRTALAGEWRYRARRIPPSFYSDFGVVANKWYWYRGRAVTEFGDVQNWWQEHIQFA